MPVAVLRFEQHPDDPPLHHISRPLAEKFLTYWHAGKRATIRLDASLIKISVPLPFGALKALVRALEREERAFHERVRPYIGPMPPVEVSSCHFRQPAGFEQKMPHYVSTRWEEVRQ